MMQHEKNSTNKWRNPRPNAKFRGGTYMGLDLTFSAENEAFGGILIRSLRELKEINSVFTRTKTFSPSDSIIEGPCNCVKLILKQTGFQSIDALTSSKEFNHEDAFGGGIIHLDLASKYNINYATEKGFYASPRVGLSLKMDKSIKGRLAAQISSSKQEFLMAPYRIIRRDCVSKIKKYRALIALSMVYGGKLEKRVRSSKECKYK